MFKNQKLIALVQVFILLAFSSFIAEGQDVNVKYNLSGVWSSENGEEMFITDSNGFLEIQGKDTASIYSSNCLVEKNTAECFGSGIQLKQGLKFLYKSTFKIKAEKEKITIEESWEGKFSGGEKIVGKTVFNQVKKKETTRDLKIERD